MNLPSDFPLARYIDHTILKPSVGLVESRQAAESAARYGCAALCLPPYLIPEAAAVLKNTGVAVQTVIGFPLGFQSSAVKIFEASEAVRLGATEIDLVINRGWLKEGREDLVEAEIRSVVKAVSPVSVKTILEISDLDLNMILTACGLSIGAGAHFIKTSTGFYGSGADADIVRAIKEHVGHRTKIKASGGIRDLAGAWSFIQAGADRLGTSSGIKILEEFYALKK